MRLFVPVTVCVALLSGCSHSNSAARKYARAPLIENPLVGAPQTGVAGMANANDNMVFTAFDGHHLCFEGGNTLSPAQAANAQYSLRFLETDAVDLKNAASLSEVIVRVVASQNQLVPVTRTVQDTVRDARGNKVGTVDRQVQELETHYQTQVQLCFPEPQRALTDRARFMVLLKEGGQMNVWGPRQAWVWRFPASEHDDQSAAAAP